MAGKGGRRSGNLRRDEEYRGRRGSSSNKLGNACRALLVVIDAYNADTSFGQDATVVSTNDLLRAVDIWVEAVRPLLTVPK